MNSDAKPDTSSNLLGASSFDVKNDTTLTPSMPGNSGNNFGDVDVKFGGSSILTPQFGQSQSDVQVAESKTEIDSSMHLQSKNNDMIATIDGDSKDSKIEGVEREESKVEYKRWNQEIIDLNQQRVEQKRLMEESRSEEKASVTEYSMQEKSNVIQNEDQGDDDDDEDDDDEEWDSDEDEEDSDEDEDEDGTLGGMTMSAGLMRMLGMDVPDEEPAGSDWVPPSHAGLDNSTRLM